MKINKKIVLAFLQMHTVKYAVHKMVIDETELAYSYQLIGENADNSLTFQGVGDLDDYVCAVVAL